MTIRPRLCDFPDCGTELKPLFQTFFCPNEEQHEAIAARKATETCKHPAVIWMGLSTYGRCLSCGKTMGP